MKKLLILPLMAVMCIVTLTLFSCAGQQVDPVESNMALMEEYCPDTPVEECILVRRAMAEGIDLRIAHDMLVNAALLTDWVAKDKVEPADISKFANGVRMFLNGGPVTGVQFLDRLFKDAEDARIAKALIRKNAKLLYSGQVLDDCTVKLLNVSLDDLELWAGEIK